MSLVLLLLTASCMVSSLFVRRPHSRHLLWFAAGAVADDCPPFGRVAELDFEYFSTNMGRCSQSSRGMEFGALSCFALLVAEIDNRNLRGIVCNLSDQFFFWLANPLPSIKIGDESEKGHRQWLLAISIFMGRRNALLITSSKYASATDSKMPTVQLVSPLCQITPATFSMLLASLFQWAASANCTLVVLVSWLDTCTTSKQPPQPFCSILGLVGCRRPAIWQAGEQMGS